VPTPIRHPPHPRAARRLAAALLAAAPLAVAPPLACAEPAQRTSSLSWVRLPGAESCIGSRALAIAVERRLQHEVFVAPSRAAVSVEGRIEQSTAPDGFRAVITVSNEAGVELGSREIRSAAPSCAAMDDDLALVIAVMIDPEAALAPPLPAAPAPPPEGPDGRSPPKPSAPPPPPRCVEPTAAPPPPSWRVSLQAGGAAMLGLLPRISGGVLIRSHVEPPRFWAFEVGGVLFPAVEAQRGTVGASFQIAEAFVSICPLTLRAFGAVLSACAGVQVGSIEANGIGLAGASGQQEEALFDVALEGRVRRRLAGPLVAGAGLGLAAPILRERFSYLGQDLFTMAPVAGTVDLSVGVEFP
jgi:hypothetical protein